MPVNCIAHGFSTLQQFVIIFVAMRYFLLTLQLLAPLLLAAQTPHVLYGQRNLAGDSTRLFFDKNGFLYPSRLIPNREMEEADNSLLGWYQNNPSVFIDIAKSYNLLVDSVNDSTCRLLNDAIAATFAEKLNREPSAAFTFLIHGFRKPFVSENRDRVSAEDFKILAEAYQQHSRVPSKIVEVYWDGMYGCCFSANSKTNKYLFQLFEMAQKNAAVTGNALKAVLCKMETSTINILTHSLGAKVGMYAVLNISDSSMRTPSARINICLIAPAIAADLILDNYVKRNAAVDSPREDNYHLYVVCNKKDFVLKKRDNRLGWFGPGPYKYGNTTLGCNFKKAALKLQSKFRQTYPSSEIRLYDLSSVGKCHHVRCYTNSGNLQQVFLDMTE